PDVAAAARRAYVGGGGPVLPVVPKAVQLGMVDEGAIDFPTHYRPRVGRGVDDATLDEMVEHLAGAERPMIFAGAGSRPGDENGHPALAEAVGATTYLDSRARGALPFVHNLRVI